MTEAVSSPSNCSTPKWIRFRIGNLQTTKDGKFIRLISIPKDGEKQTNEEYPTFVDFSGYRISDVVEVLIEDNKVTGIRFPPGMEPVDNVPVVKGQSSKAAESPKTTPVPEIQTPQKVEPPKQTQTSAPVVQKPKSCKLLKREGDSKVLILKLDGNEEWFQVTEEGKKNLVRLKDGQNVKLDFDRVGSEYHVKMLLPADENGKYDKDGWVKGTEGKGRGRPFDPVADAKRQRMIVRQSSLERAESLWINGNPGRDPTPEDEDKILTRAEKFEKWVMRDVL